MSAATSVSGSSDNVMSALSERSRACIERLRDHEPANEYVQFTSQHLISGRVRSVPCPKNDLLISNLSRPLTPKPDIGSSLVPRHVHQHHQPEPASKCAAVLVLLYERERGGGGLRVLLTTRSKELRSHPGQTALPGGKVDQDDAGVVEAAVSKTSHQTSPSPPVPSKFPCLLFPPFLSLFYFILRGVCVGLQYREANEEVALPLRSPHVHTLCTLEPVVSPHGVVVTPVVAHLDDVSVLEELRAAPGEVARIFDHPLEAVLDPELARGEEGLVPHGSEHWPYEPELNVRRFHASSILAFSVPCSS